MDYLRGQVVYPAYLVIFLVTENMAGGKRGDTTGKICQIEFTETSLFY
jgi:hypothetical protein